VVDNNFGVPAGWYPDPLGLPQLRWWDAQAWTEHTSEARAPIVVQPATRLAYADDEEFPSRREQRERERQQSGDLLQAELATETSVDHEELSAQPLLAMTLRELEPPPADTVEDAALGPRRASTHANAVPAASTLSALAEEQAPKRVIKTTGTYTVASWLIAAMPLIQLLVCIGLILGGLGQNQQLILTVVLFPYLIVVGLAFYDRLLLQVWGHEKPASGAWAFLREPGYLIARAVRTFAQTGKGFAPLAVFAAAATSVLAGILILPGLLISVFPQPFSAEIERSVQADAATLGAALTVACPAPPLLVGQTFTCIATKPSGKTDSIAVSLQRENGWITWRVEDWGVWILTAD
jgi:hypothetical protein